MPVVTRRFFMTLLMLAAGHSLASEPIINLSVSGEVAPGVYGRVDIGNSPPPQVVYTRPIVVIQQGAPVHAGPVYLHVPPGHAKKWSKHCHKYNACAQPVYFVKSVEYESGAKKRGSEKSHGKENGKGKGKENGKGNNK